MWWKLTLLTSVGFSCLSIVWNVMEKCTPIPPNVKDKQSILNQIMNSSIIFWIDKVKK